MATVKRKQHEKLDDKNIERVIELLEQQKPITQKAACEILNIAVNGARLKKIIEEYKNTKIVDAQRRAANRGKPASDYEVKTVIEMYLDGDAINDISKSLYRSNDFVKKIIDRVGVPARVSGATYMTVPMLPEQCISDNFQIGETVWSARYQSPAEICAIQGMSSDGLSTVYQIYVFERAVEPEEVFFSSWGKAGFYANQTAYDLGRLDHLKPFGVDIMRTVK